MTQQARPFPLLTPTARSLTALAAASPKRQKLTNTPPSAAMAAAKMEIVSPASPMGLRLTSDINKAATVFLSHVRRTFARHPVDYTGELVRLLDDIATFTRTSASAASAVANQTPEETIMQLYKLLAADGYCCIILAKGVDQPLTFNDTVLHGNYVICISPLDEDDIGSDQNPVSGMIFSVYKRRSSTSLPGRGMDLRQKLSDQVAAGYASYSSATTLHYTMGHGVYSFVLHPVALQYFLQPAMRLSIPENPSTIYTDRCLLRKPTPIAAALNTLVDRMCSSIFTTGCLVGDVHQLVQTGGLVVAANVHLMCEAASLAFVVEQAGGVATDEFGERILDMAITEDYNVVVTLVLGSPSIHKTLGLKPVADLNGNGTALEH